MEIQHVHRLRSDDLTWRELGERIVILDLRTSWYLTIESSAVTVWKLLQTGATTDALVTAVCAEYDVDAATALADIEQFLGDLEDKGLLA